MRRFVLTLVGLSCLVGCTSLPTLDLPEPPDAPAPVPAPAEAEVAVVAAPEPEPAEVAEPVAPMPGVAAPEPEPAEVVAAAPKGRAVAEVGSEVITLPELTAAVKARIAAMPAGSKPSRRQIIAMAKTTLKTMVARSLVMQEARDVMGGPDAVRQATSAIEARWLRDEMPAVLRGENVATEDALRVKLAARGTSPEALREEFVVRGLALDLMAREGSSRDLDAYLDAMRAKRPITSIMSPAELATAGRLAAEAEAEAERATSDE